MQTDLSETVGSECARVISLVCSRIEVRCSSMHAPFVHHNAATVRSVDWAACAVAHEARPTLTVRRCAWPEDVAPRICVTLYGPLFYGARHEVASTVLDIRARIVVDRIRHHTATNGLNA